MISFHIVKVWRTLSQANGDWLTNREIAARAAMSERTVRAKTARFFAAGILDRMELYPGYRYRLRQNPENSGLIAELKRADEAFGIE